MARVEVEVERGMEEVDLRVRARKDDIVELARWLLGSQRLGRESSRQSVRLTLTAPTHDGVPNPALRAHDH
jgi:hypothetical protein